jgi:hypothetical protein
VTTPYGTKESGAVVFVVLRIAAGETKHERRRSRSVGGRGAETVREVEQIVGILPGHIETDDEVNRAMPPDDAFEPLPITRLW